METDKTNMRLDSRPLYLRAEEALAGLLQEGTYLPGDQLPPEQELAQQLGISRSTLREALRAFEERGIIVRRRGVGTFVSEHNIFIESGLETLESIDTIAGRRGLNIRTEKLNIATLDADDELASRLNVAPGSPVTVVTRIKTAAGKPVAYMYDAIPAEIFGREEIQKGFKGSVLDFLLESGTVEVSYARADIKPVRPDTGLSLLVELGYPRALLLLEETLFDVEGRVIDFSRNYFLPEFFNFHVVRRVVR